MTIDNYGEKYPLDFPKTELGGKIQLAKTPVAGTKILKT